MTRTSWVEICVSDLGQSISWFEHTLGFRVIARDANEYAELSHGETTIQLAVDDAPYWASERPHLQKPGQRGSGVEIVLLVENIDAIYHQAQHAKADVVRELANYPWHMRQFWVRHPDGYLIRPAQKILSVNPAIYHRQIANAFQHTTRRILEELTKIKKAADTLVRQRDYLEAATIYDMLITEIFEESHIYYDESANEYFDYAEEPYYPEEEGLEELVTECIEALGHCLTDKRTDRVAREKIIRTLFDIYLYDLHDESPLGFATSASDQLVRYATQLERDTTIAERIYTLLADENEKAIDGLDQAYGRLLLKLGQGTLSDEAYLRICRETGLTSKLIGRLLALGRVEEAERATQSVDDEELLELADQFIQQKQDMVAEHLVRARLKEKPDMYVLMWLQHYYQTRGNQVAELEMTTMLFHAHPLLSYYQELHNLASKLNRWESIRLDALTFLEQADNTQLLIQIALDENEIDTALKLLKTITVKDRYGYTYTSSSLYYMHEINLTVAKAAEETRPHEAIQIYQQHAERLIALRGRNNYQEACSYLTKIRSLYEQLEECEIWVQYVATIHKQSSSLRALREELSKAEL